MRATLFLCILALASWSHGAVPSEFRDKIGKAAPDFTFQTSDGQSHRVKDFRGKWLLLQLGASWCPPSEATAVVFSQIRGKLEGHPFEFVEIYDDFTLADVELFSFTQFRGMRARTPDVPKFYQVGFIPAWYLIGPNGTVRLAGAYAPPRELRSLIEGELGRDQTLRFPALEPSPAEEAVEQAVEAEGARDWKKALGAWEEVLGADPANEMSLKGFIRAIAWTKGYERANRALRELLKMQPGYHDRVRVFQADYAIKGGELSDGVPLLESLRKAHPESVYLRAWGLPFEKLPEEASQEETGILLMAVRRGVGGSVKEYLACVLEAQGKRSEAETLFKESGEGGVGHEKMIAYAAFLHRSANDRAALAALQPAPGSYTAATANPVQAWMEMLRHTTVESWAEMVPYARRYAEVRPEKVQGLLFQLLAALRSSQAEEAKRLRTAIEKFLAESDRYAPTRALLAGTPRRDDLLRIPDPHVRFDSALACILLAEMDGDRERARDTRAEALRAFQGFSWFHTILHGLSRQAK